MFRMLATVFLAGLLGGTCWARHPKEQPTPPPAQYTILEASPMSVTVDIGNDNHATYNITKNTKLTLNGEPANPDDLRAGMVTSVELAPDNETALSLTAQSAPRVIQQGRKLGTHTWW